MPSDPVIFSILIPSVPSRITTFLCPLFAKLQRQCEGKHVELLCLLDNKQRSIGLKRDSLVQASRGEYLAFVDDDDDISTDYVESIVSAIKNNPGVDIVVFNQKAILNGENPFTVRFGIEFENEPVWRNALGVWQNIVRKPFHVCVWKSAIAKQHRFPDASNGEDWHWARRVLTEVKTQVRIDKILHIYRFDNRVTEAALDYAD